LLVYLNGTDRTSLNLNIDGASSGDDIVSAVGTAQPNTVVVTISPGPYLTNWSTHIKALVDFGFPGEQEGEAVCDILFGIANPAGKMPHTMPHVWNEVQMTTAQCVVLPSPLTLFLT
jgi:beta-glucosidase